MSLLKQNIAANLLGNGWCALISIATIPGYIYFMGIESYALVGIHATLMTVCTILDFGMSTTINREMARLTSLPDRTQDLVNLVRSLEVINWIIAGCIGVLVCSLSHLIAYSWLKPTRLTSQHVEQAVYLMGISMLFQWPLNFYSGGLIGLQKQVLLNVITAGMTTARAIGAIFVLWLISPTIKAFFVWNVGINVLHFLTLSLSFKSKLPRAAARPAFQSGLIGGVWRFAAGMGSISIVSMMISQMDKLILSKLLTLEIFGYYTLASVAATSFSRLMGPLVSAIFPRLTQLITLGEMERLRQVYHSGCQLMSVLIMPVTFLFVFFSKEILSLWTGNPVTAEKTSTLVGFLALATMFNGLSHIPLSLQYAFGKTRMVFLSTLGMLIVMTPVIVLTTRCYGAAGTTAALMLVHMTYSFSITYLIHRYHLTQEGKDWYVRDVGIPLIVSSVVMGSGRMLIHGGMSVPGIVLSLSTVTIATVALTAYSAPAVRTWAIDFLAAIPRKYLYGIN